MKVNKLECGCRNDGHQWIEQCPKHYEEHRELHERAKRDHDKVSVDNSDLI